MTKDSLNKHSLPDTPGVYFFLGVQKEILYIGKATSLKSRVRSYFSNDIKDKRSPLIEKMVQEAKQIDYTTTDSVLEALILETNLIRTHKPRYNTKSKDDKSYNHLIITAEEWPRVLVIRGKDLNNYFADGIIKYEFGPYTSSQMLRDALKIIRRLFKFYDTKSDINKTKSRLERGKIDFNRQIGLYPDKCSREEYLTTIRHIRLFFEGKKQQIIKELEREMMKLAKQEKFEEAQIIKKRIFSLQHIQDISLLKNNLRTHRDDRTIRIEAYDVAHLQGTDMVGAMTVIEGESVTKSEYRKFNIKGLNKANDPQALNEMLTRRLNHKNWSLPQIIVVDGNQVQKKVAETILKQNQLTIPVVAVVKDDKHRPNRIIGQKSLITEHKNAILLANAEAHRFALSFHKAKRSAKLKK